MEVPINESLNRSEDGKTGLTDNEDRFGLSALAPMAWLTLVWGLMLLMLYFVGYLAPDEGTDFTRAADAIKAFGVDIAARRGALAYSGVTQSGVRLARVSVGGADVQSAGGKLVPLTRCAGECIDSTAAVATGIQRLGRKNTVQRLTL